MIDHETSFQKFRTPRGTHVRHSRSVSAMAVEVLDCEGFAHFLETKGLHKDIVSVFVDNRICRQAFLALTEDLKELVPIIGNRVHVREILQRA